MSCCSCAARAPLVESLKSQSPQALWQNKLKPKDPFDLTAASPGHLAVQNPLDPSSAANSAEPTSATKAPGTGLLLDITA